MADKTVVDCETGEVTTEPLTAEEEAQRAADNAGFDEQAWAALRAERNSRLAASDWTQVADATANPDDWTAYRQELRDVPQTTDDPAAVEWPEPPPEPGELG